MPARQPLRLTRHYSKLSEKQTDEVVSILAGLIVNYVKNTAHSAPEDEQVTPETQEVQA